MTQTFTPALDLTADQTKKHEEEVNALPEFAAPSDNTIQNILNYSKNLEVKTSKFVKEVEILKS